MHLEVHFDNTAGVGQSLAGTCHPVGGSNRELQAKASLSRRVDVYFSGLARFSPCHRKAGSVFTSRTVVARMSFYWSMFSTQTSVGPLIFFVRFVTMKACSYIVSVQEEADNTSQFSPPPPPPPQPLPSPIQQRLSEAAVFVQKQIEREKKTTT